MRNKTKLLILFVVIFGILNVERAMAVYDPSLGRWINRDPIGKDGGINLYNYAINDPINIIDPLGLKPRDLEYITGLDTLERVLIGMPQRFTTPEQLVTLIKSDLQPGDTIRTLTIDAHGFLDGNAIVLADAGGNHVWGFAGQMGSDQAIQALEAIKPLMDKNGIVVFKECYSAQDQSGVNTMKLIAKILQAPVIGSIGDYNLWDGWTNGKVTVYPDGRVVKSK